MRFSISKEKPSSASSATKQVGLTTTIAGAEKDSLAQLEEALKSLPKECARTAGRVQSLRETILPAKGKDVKCAGADLGAAQGKTHAENENRRLLAEIQELEKTPDGESWREYDVRHCKLSQARAELERVERLLQHYAAPTLDIRFAASRVEKVKAEIRQHEGELNRLESWGPSAFMDIKGSLKEAQVSLLRDASVHLRNFVACWSRIQELGAAYEEAANRYIVVSQNFARSLVDINAGLQPPLPRIQSKNASGMARHAAELKEWKKRHQVVQEAPHRRWPGQDFDFGTFLKSISRLVS